MDILIAISIIINIALQSVILFFVSKPKIIEIYKDPVGTKQRVVMTPTGTFKHEEKRKPVNNDDESLVLRDE
jgi:hypothetical protein